MFARYVILLFARNMPPPIVGVINPTNLSQYRNFEKRRDGRQGIHNTAPSHIRRGCRHK